MALPPLIGYGSFGLFAANSMAATMITSVKEMQERLGGTRPRHVHDTPTTRPRHVPQADTPDPAGMPPRLSAARREARALVAPLLGASEPGFPSGWSGAAV